MILVVRTESEGSKVLMAIAGRNSHPARAMMFAVSQHGANRVFLSPDRAWCRIGPWSA